MKTLRHLATAACAALAFTLTACDVDDGLVTLPDGTEVLSTVDGKPSSKGVTVMSSEDFADLDELIRYQRDMAYRGMQNSLPGSPKYQAWESRLARAEKHYRQVKTIEEVGYEGLIAEETAHLPPDKVREVYEAFWPIIAAERAGALSQTGPYRSSR